MREHAAGTASVLLVALSTISGAEPSGAATATAWRVFAGPALVSHSLDSAFDSSYSPPFLSTSYTSQATQRLPLEADGATGLVLAIERDLSPHLGLQLSAGYTAADVDGEPGHYDLAMRYVSRQPPSYEPVEHVQRRSLEPPPATGRLKSFALALDLVASARLGSIGRAGVVAGPAWVRSRGAAQSLVYTVYRMGGHSTAFYEDHLVSFTFPADTLALDAGVFVDLQLGSRVGLRLDARYTWAPERDVTVTVDEVVNADEIVFTVETPEIQRGLDPAPVRLDPSLLRASLGLVLRF